MINKRRLVNTFKALVQIESLSLHEKKVMTFVQKELEKIGMVGRFIGKVPGGEIGSLLVNIPGQGVSGPCLLLNAHVDTVAPGKKIKPIERNGMLFTDGSTILGADNKAGVAAILEVLRVLKEKKLQHPPLQALFTIAEEIGLTGAKHLPKGAITADYGLVLDGGDIDIVVNKAPSQSSVTANIIGRAAHAGIRPEEGVNAIQVASVAIACLKIGRIDEETTTNIGIIKGGKATNIVPDEVEINGEARSHNVKKLDREVAKMEKALVRACEEFGARLKLKIERVYTSFETKKNEAVFFSLLTAMKSLGIKPQIKKTGGGSDANIFNERGIPTLIVGVGADHVHTTREQLKIDDLCKGTEIVLKTVSGLTQWTNSKKN